MFHSFGVASSLSFKAWDYYFCNYLFFVALVKPCLNSYDYRSSLLEAFNGVSTYYSSSLIPG